MQVNIGGERLGSGNKMNVKLHGYERSTHDTGLIIRTTMSSGTLVPFLSEVALPGDTFDIDLNCDVLTHPTIGPLFGSFKVQLDMFQIPIRLYQAQLHMNALNIGRDMSAVKLPQIKVTSANFDITKPIDNQQVNPSHLLSYLDIRGLGWEPNPEVNSTVREFNAIPWLAYWDIYKNYYANKQEEIGAMIHREAAPSAATLTQMSIFETTFGAEITLFPAVSLPQDGTMLANSYAIITGTNLDTAKFNAIKVTAYPVGFPVGLPFELPELFENISLLNDSTIICTVPKYVGIPLTWDQINYDETNYGYQPTTPKVVTFPLENIDNMRMAILQHTPQTDAFVVDEASPAPYGLPLKFDEAEGEYCTLYNQEGLALKTYQSDLFNNWIDTEWIDGPDGISAVTAIDTTGGEFTIDELNMKKKIYDMLNRIAVSGGSYDDWQDVTYGHGRHRSAESPMYIGGLIKNLVFQEVVSNATSEGEPLGTLAGRGRLGSLHKGGSIVAKIDEPSYIMGIVSLTPIIDYSQGNKWDTNLKTMNDFHKPALDAIGFQDLITDQMAWWDTINVSATNTQTFKSAGKQPAWINYMTNVNKVRGNFADQSQQMFMVLNRRYEMTQVDSVTSPTISDLTTYIDPSKFNHIFADTRLDAQNFWVQIRIDNNARRKMSAKVIPNL